MARRKGDGVGGRGNRKPIEIKIAQGSLNSTREAKNYPVLPKGVPLPPAWLTDAQRAVWLRLAQCVAPMYITTEADVVAFEAFVNVMVDIQVARASLEMHGNAIFTETESKYGTTIKTRPEWKVLSDLDKRMLTYLSRFGMTPADRGRVSSLKPQGKGNTFEQFK